MVMRKHSWLLLVLAVLVVSSLYATAANANAAGSSGSGDWTMFRHDLSNSGVSSEGNLTGSVGFSWVFSTGGMVRTSAAVAGGCVYMGSWDGFFYCLNASDGGLVWKFAIRQVIASSPAVSDGCVYFGADDGYVYALVMDSGALIWKTQIGGEIRGSPTVAGGVVYIGSGDHDLYALDAASGAVVWSFSTPYRVVSTPAIVNGTLYVATDDYNVYALNTSSGEEFWATHTGATTSSPTVYGGSVYVGSVDGYVCALNASNGVIEWEYLTQGSVYSSPAVCDGRVYIGSDDTNVYCLDASTGTVLWRASTGFWVRSSPCVWDGNVYVGSHDYSVYCFNALTGAKEWSFATADYVEGSPTVAEGMLYFGSDDFHIYALTLNASTSEPLPQFFTQSFPWSTVVFDAAAVAVAAVIAFSVAQFARRSWGGTRRSLSVGRGRRILAWLSLHRDAVFIVTILGLSSIFFVNLGSGHLWVADEQTYSQWANHMVKSGDYVTPWADGFLSFYISKPPLTMWLMALGYQAFGVTNFASRVGIAVTGVLSLVAVFYLGRKLYNSYVGFLSAIILATFTTFYEFATHAMTDAPFLLFTVCSIYFFVVSEKTEKPTKYAALSGVFLGLAFMTKQLIALLIPLIIFVYLVAAHRSLRFLVSKRFTLFWAVGLLVFAPWLTYMSLRFGTAFLQVYFSYSDLSRIVSPLEGHARGYLYYFTYMWQNENLLWVLLLPFGAFLGTLRAVFKRSCPDTLLIVWMVIVVAFFTLAQTRIYYYILPAFPAFAVAIGNLLYQTSSKIVALFHRLGRKIRRC